MSGGQCGTRMHVGVDSAVGEGPRFAQHHSQVVRKCMGFSGQSSVRNKICSGSKTTDFEVFVSE